MSKKLSKNAVEKELHKGKSYFEIAVKQGFYKTDIKKMFFKLKLN